MRDLSDDEARIAARLTALCERDTTSGREDRGLEVLLALLREDGAEVLTHEVEPGRTNVLALFGAPRALFTTHLDCVPPFLPVRREGKTVHGRGACDAKGQIVLFLEAVRLLAARGFHDTAFLGVVGEETDAKGAAAAGVWKDRLEPCRLIVNGEPTELKLGSGQRGFLHLRLRCAGRPAHSGSPELGRSAVLALIDWIQALRRRVDPRDVELGPEVWNVGLIAGGEAANVVPAQATAEVLARTLPGSDFLETVKRHAPEGGTIEVVVDEEPDRFDRIPGFTPVALPFGSDLPALRRLLPEARAALVGAGTIRVAHTADERIDLDEIQAGAALVRDLVHAAFPGEIP